MFLRYLSLLPAQRIRLRKALVGFSILSSFALLSACQMSPLAPYTSNPNLHFDAHNGAPFKHLLVRNHTPISDSRNEKKALNVYIEGDGRPWHTRTSVAWDPTPRTARMLALMAIDDAPAIYLGRPCYFSLEDPQCEPIWWTHKRYSEQVIRSMNRVLDQNARNVDTIRLIGHSGGGALAMLMAAQRNDVEAVITLAGNIDIVRWTHLHKYSPLIGSLNPADYPLPKTIRQFHFVGSEDFNTPATLIEAALYMQPRESIYLHTVQVIQGNDHLCCWKEHWPRLLTSINKDLETSSPE